MGKIALVVGPHGVGKSTLFKFARNKGDVIVFEGIQLPTDGYDLRKKADFLAYEALYVENINHNNHIIKDDDRDGLVVRSIEESSYYFHFYNGENVMDEYKMIFDDKKNIKSDCIFFLDANFDILQERCRNDSVRDMEETKSWYQNEYTRYIEYWKNYPGIIIIDTNGLTTASIYGEIRHIMQTM